MILSYKSCQLKITDNCWEDSIFFVRDKLIIKEKYIPSAVHHSQRLSITPSTSPVRLLPKVFSPHSLNVAITPKSKSAIPENQDDRSVFPGVKPINADGTGRVGLRPRNK